jgi:hypothetical protein
MSFVVFIRICAFGFFLFLIPFFSKNSNFRLRFFSMLSFAAVIWGQAQIKVCDVKLSVLNGGDLPDSIPARPSNKIIHQNPAICSSAKLVSWADISIPAAIKIIESCKAASLPEHEFKEALGGFSVILFKAIG